MKDLYATARPHHAPPIPGALDGVARLRALGFRLVIVTAREQRDMPETMRWLGEHFPGASPLRHRPDRGARGLTGCADVFESVVCTGLGKDAVDWTGNEIPTKLTKPEVRGHLLPSHSYLTRSRGKVCRSLKALALIDDALENALACATSDPPTPVLLFGANEWNKRVSRVSSVAPSGSGAEAHERSTVREGDAAGIDITQMSFAERLRYENGREFWHDDARAAESRVPEGAPVTRVRDWDEVVRWFVKHHPAA